MRVHKSGQMALELPEHVSTDPHDVWTDLGIAL
jgi:hypothetical protein